MSYCKECQTEVGDHQPIQDDEAHCECEGFDLHCSCKCHLDEGQCECDVFDLCSHCADHRLNFEAERKALIEWILSADCDPQVIQ